MTDIKIWRLNECDWVAAETLDDAKRCLCDLIEGDVPMTAEFEKDYIEEPYEEQGLDTLFICDEDDPTYKKTFRQALEEMKTDGTVFPSHFATTEW